MIPILQRRKIGRLRLVLMFEHYRRFEIRNRGYRVFRVLAGHSECCNIFRFATVAVKPELKVT